MPKKLAQQKGSKKQLISELKEAKHELALIEKGEKKARPIEELLKTLSHLN